MDRLPEREKDVLQTAAVVGRTFGEGLLQRIMARIAPRDEVDVGAALSALAAAEFVYQTALYPDREYTFRHPLTRDVAQRSLLREQRTRIHAEAAVQARARYDYGEAHLHLEAALELLGEQPETLERLRHELALLEDLGTTLFGMRGYGDEDGARAFARMRELAERMDGTPARLQAMQGQLTVHTMRAEFSAARVLGEKMLALAEHLGNPADTAIALSLLGAVSFSIGDVAAAERHAERARALFDPHAPPTPDDVGIPSSILVASANGYFGHVARARAMAREALDRAAVLDTPFHRALATNLVAQIHMLLDDAAGAAPFAREAEDLAGEYELAGFRITATMVRAWCDIEAGLVVPGLATLQGAFDEYGATGQRFSTTCFSLLLARGHLAAGDGAGALRAVDAALRFAAETGERVYEPVAVSAEG